MTNGDRGGGQDPERNLASARAALDEALLREPGRLLSVLIRALGDFDRAEDALHDAVQRALERWPADGVPRNPAGWLVTTARRGAIDRLRRSARWERKASELAALARLEADERREREADGASDRERSGIGDERLRLIFTCCHPSLPLEARVALTLHSVGGRSVAEIARALLTSEEAMKKRLARARARIRSAGIPYAVPSDDLLAPRLDGVLAVLYLIFNEGYLPTRGAAASDADTSREAIRLARLLADALPEPEVLGLLALMLIHDARRASRVAPDGALVLLEDQDRALWDRAAIDEGRRCLEAAAERGRPGPYQLQAAIALAHARAASAADTDWRQIAALYDRLLERSPNPVLALNRAVAHGMAFGPEVGLTLVEGIAGLERYHLYEATRADLLRRLGRPAEAAAAYRRALERASNRRERDYLERRVAECEADGSRPAAT